MVLQEETTNNQASCPVCFDLSYDIAFAAKGGTTWDGYPAGLSKGKQLLQIKFGPRLREDLVSGAETEKCEYCELLVRVVDCFCAWKQNHTCQVHVTLCDNGAVELQYCGIVVLLYTPSGHDAAWGRLPPAPPISRSGRCERATDFMRQQVAMCLRDHAQCRPDSPRLPTRLLDTGGGATDGVKSLKLWEPPSSVSARYTALSYCWGGNPGLKTTKSTVHHMFDSIDEDLLPATIADAVEVTRNLGVRYLWVDALCIIQDDEQDWRHEASLMSNVYGNAFLTISASSAENCDLSFLDQHRVVNDEEVLFPLRACSGKSPDGQAVAVRRSVTSGFHQRRFAPIVDPVMRRAWTFQEHFLSTRVISFSTHEMQWICRATQACECNHPGEDGHKSLESVRRALEGKAALDGKVEEEEDEAAGQLTADSYFTRTKIVKNFLNEWGWIVESYSQRNLSYRRDVLPALSGVASAYLDMIMNSTMVHIPGEGARTTTWRYLAGLWEPYLIHGLFWASSGLGELLDDEYTGPSWSWVSTANRGPNAVFCSLDWLEPRARVVDVRCALANPEFPLGQVLREGTYLRVAGTVFEVRAETLRGCRLYWVHGHNDGIRGSGMLDAPVEAVSINTSPGTSPPKGGRRPPVETLRRKRFGSPNPTVDDDEDEDKTEYRLWVLYLGLQYNYGQVQEAFLVLTKSDSPSNHTFERVGVAYGTSVKDGNNKELDRFEMEPDWEFLTFPVEQMHHEGKGIETVTIV